MRAPHFTLAPVVVLLASAQFLDYMSDAVGRGSVSRLWYLSPTLVVLLAALIGGDFIAGPAISITAPNPARTSFSCCCLDMVYPQPPWVFGMMYGPC